MMNTTITSQDKIKLLNQMLEDLAGDEFDANGDSENDIESTLKHYVPNVQFSTIDNIY